MSSKWRKSNYSTTNGSVAVTGGSVILVRDSKDKTGDGEILRFSPEEFEVRVLEPIKNGTFDWKETFNGLVFNEEERKAFILGVLDGEFDLEKV